ncbi:MAG: hypothetical protein AMS14_05180, partial [Planctomycetes bacterium DG_20]
MTAALLLAALVTVAAGPPVAPPPPPWSAEDLEREERFVAALEARGLDDLLLDYYRRELRRPGLT